MEFYTFNFSPYGSPRTGQFGVAKGPHQIIPDQQRNDLQVVIQQQPVKYHPVCIFYLDFQFELFHTLFDNVHTVNLQQS